MLSELKIYFYIFALIEALSMRGMQLHPGKGASEPLLQTVNMIPLPPPVLYRILLDDLCD